MSRAAGAATVVAAGTLYALGRSVVTADEAWFLQVLHRVATGEVLYRDVFFGATPLSVQLLAPLAGWLGAEVWLVRGALVVCLAATALLSSQILRQLGSRRAFAWLLAAALLLLAFPVPCAPYASLATLFLLAALAAVLRWDGGERASRQALVLVLAGAACGACFVLKQNIGVYALGAAFCAVGWGAAGAVAARELLRSLGVLAASFAVAAALPLAATAWSGGLPGLLDYGFFGKGPYLRLARVGYLDGLRGAIGPVGQAVFLLPPLAWAGLAVTWRNGDGPARRRTLILAAFCAAATLAIFPRADEVHLAYLMPVFLIVLAFVWERHPLARTRVGRLAHAAAAIALPALLAVRTAGPLAGLSDGTARLSSLPHFRGVVMPADALQRIRARSDRLRQAGGQGTFLLASEAGLFYLASGLRNPTPFDYPLVTAFGRQGEARVVAAIRSGAIPRVCVDSKVLARPLRPPLLAALVERELVPAGDGGFCALYRPRS